MPIMENNSIEISIMFFRDIITNIAAKVNERIVCGAKSFINLVILVLPNLLFKYLNS